jgi:hypothetical protein
MDRKFDLENVENVVNEDALENEDGWKTDDNNEAAENGAENRKKNKKN